MSLTFVTFVHVPCFLLNSTPGTTFLLPPLLLHPLQKKKTNKSYGYGACIKIDGVISQDTVSEKVVAKPATLHYYGYSRLQMAESGHEDEHATLLGDEGLRAGGQVLKLG